MENFDLDASTIQRQNLIDSGNIFVETDGDCPETKTYTMRVPVSDYYLTVWMVEENGCQPSHLCISVENKNGTEDQPIATFEGDFFGDIEYRLFKDPDDCRWTEAGRIYVGNICDDDEESEE